MISIYVAKREKDFFYRLLLLLLPRGSLLVFHRWPWRTMAVGNPNRERVESEGNYDWTERGRSKVYICMYARKRMFCRAE